MTTAAADPWFETEDAEDFWDDDLGPIDDDAAWDVGDTDTAENTTEPGSISAPQTSVSLNEEKKVNGALEDGASKDSGFLSERVETEPSEEPFAETGSVSDTKAVSETNSGASGTKPGTNPEANSGTSPKTNSGTNPETNSEINPETKSKTNPISVTNSETNTMFQTETEDATESEDIKKSKETAEVGEVEESDTKDPGNIAENGTKNTEDTEVPEGIKDHDTILPDTQNLDTSDTQNLDTSDTQNLDTSVTQNLDTHDTKDSQDTTVVLENDLPEHTEVFSIQADPENGSTGLKDMGSDSNGVISTPENTPRVDSLVDGAIGEVPYKVSSELLMHDEDTASTAVEYLEIGFEPSYSAPGTLNGSTTSVLQPEESKTHSDHDLNSPSVVAESAAVNESSSSKSIPNIECLDPEPASHDQVEAPTGQEKGLNDLHTVSEPTLISESENLADKQPVKPEKRECVPESDAEQESKSSEIASTQENKPEVKPTDSNEQHGNGNCKPIATLEHDTLDSKNGIQASIPSALSMEVSESNQVEMLKSQIQQLKKELETKMVSANSDASSDVQSLESRLAEVEKERDDAKRQLEGFLSKISSMKTVVRNYKLTQEELEESQQEVAQLKERADALEHEKEASEEENLQLLVQKEKLENRVAVLESESEKSANTIRELKTRTGDLNSECERLSQQLSSLRREYSSKDDTLQDEKYALENEVSKLTKKINEIKVTYNELEIAEQDLRMENKNLQLMIEELKGSLVAKEKEEERYTSLIESNKQTFETEKITWQTRMQEIEKELQSTQNQLNQTQEESRQLLEKVQESEDQRAKLAEENVKITQLQEEIHSKQVIIGKLRHEAVILNEHLTKSLSMLKQNSGDSETTVDKELVSNLIVKFVQIPRGDAKKFETLSLIAGLLNWDEKRKIDAGLVNSGVKNGEDGKPPARSSIISLWADFLDKESKNKN